MPRLQSTQKSYTFSVNSTFFNINLLQRRQGKERVESVGNVPQLESKTKVFPNQTD